MKALLYNWIISRLLVRLMMGVDIMEKKIADLQKKLDQKYPGCIQVELDQSRIVLTGVMNSWEDIIDACKMCVQKDKNIHVVNHIELKGVKKPQMRISSIQDTKYDGRHCDVLIIGGGISGASIARELSRYKLDILLVEKESDLAMQASGRNDGEIHPGVDLNKGSLKQKYVVKSNRSFDQLCQELDVPFKRVGQIVGFKDKKLYPIIWAYAMQRKYICGVDDTCLISRKKIKELEPNLSDDIQFGLYNPMAGSVSPYGLTIAYGENAIQNGVEIALNTAVLSMEVNNHKIIRVTTNRGMIYPDIVINAAGVFADDIAKMADDEFFSIHPRKGTDSILDLKAGKMISSIVSTKTLKKDNSHSKGGGIVHTVHDNLLIGPDAIETYEKENFATERKSIDQVFSKHQKTSNIRQSDIITYFTGVRAATFEEDFVIEKGRNTKNIVHCAGIQSPGLTTAPAVSKDVVKMTIDLLSEHKTVEKNELFNPIRKGIPDLKHMDLKKRNELIQKNPDYGIIICRCEEISKGEILDALNSVLEVTTIDGVKKRVRPGMGRCQGGFCMPLVAKIISEYKNIPLSEVRKSGADSIISYGKTKENTDETI